MIKGRLLSRRVTRRTTLLAGVMTATLALGACSTDDGSAAGGDDVYEIGINQLVQHPALDESVAGFKEAFEDADIDVNWDDQNANGEQSTALTIAQQLDTAKKDLILAVATPAAQAAAQVIKDAPILFTAVTDAETAELVDSNDKPGANVTGTSDLAPLAPQLDLVEKIVPETKTIGVVYASGEVNSKVQVDALEEEAKKRDWKVKSQTVTTVNEIQQAAGALGDVDAIYVPTDNMVVSGIASLVQKAEEKDIPVFGAEAGTVEGGAIATVGINYRELGKQTGEMAIRILEDGDDPADMPVETATEFSYVVNEEAAERMGVTIPDDILADSDKVGDN